MIDQEVQLLLDEKQDEILTGMPVPQDGKVGDIRTNVAHKGKFYNMMKVGIDSWRYSAPFSQVPSIHTMDDYLLKSGGKMLNGSLLDAYDVTVRNGLTLSGLSPGDAVLVLDGTGKVVTDENLAWDGSVLAITGTQDIMHTATEADDHALEIDCNAAGFGDVKAIDIDYITGAIAAGQDEGIILVNIDESLATGGDVFALAVLATEGSAGIYGLKAGALVGPIHQDSGTFANMDSALVNAVDRLTEFTTSDPGGANNVEIFSADNDTVTIGDAATFEEIEFLLATAASVSIKPTFEFSTGVGAWTAFTPVDGTNGMRNTGVIAWDVADMPTWAVGAGAEYLIRITRTQNNLTTVPVEDKVQIAATTTYEWTKDGDVFIRNLGRDADNLLDFATDNEITFRVGAADRGTWTATGLGVGTSSPQRGVHISGSGPGLRFSDTNAGTDQAVTGTLEFYRGNTTNRVAYLAMDSNSNDIMALATDYAAGILQFRTGNAVAAMTIDASQSVGIGTATPLSPFEVASTYVSDLLADNPATVRTAIPGVGYGLLFRQHRGTLAVKTASSTVDGSRIAWQVYDGTNFQLAAEIQGKADSQVPAAGDSPGRLEFYTTPDGSATPALAMTIKNTGFVGIGTATPGAALEIDAGTGLILNVTGQAYSAPLRFEENAITRWRQISVAGDLGFERYDAAGNSVDQPLTLDVGGSVGINIAAPLAKLHIDQASTTAAIPVLTLDQADISDGFINFIGSDRGVITGATNSLKSVRVELGGVVYRLALYVDA